MYLDHNASAPVLPAAAQAAAEWMLGPAGNASSVHAAGRRARAAVERARRQVASALGGSPRELVFTSGATEALHLAVCGLVPVGGHVVASAVEHPALFGACAVAEARITRIPVDQAGRVRPDDFAAATRPDTALVCLMAAQNETGNVYPVAEVARVVAPVPVLCDAVQAVGRRPLDVSTLGARLVVVSSHKLGGPQGAGALWVRAGTSLRPVLAGGPQERGRRAGTENVAALVGFGVAAEAIPDRLSAMARVAAMRDAVRAALEATVVLHGTPELPNTLSFRVPGIEGDVLLAALDLEGVCISSGSACSSGAVEPSPVLRALGLSEDEARGGLRVSLGPETTEAEVERFMDVFTRVVERTRERLACA